MLRRGRSATLLSVPMELRGRWGHALREAAGKVLERMRLVALEDVRLLSDCQPTRLRIEKRASGFPCIWLHDEHDKCGLSTAWIIVVAIGERDWSKLTYQFGHELGHVLCNSWQQFAKPMVPCQWLEEAIVEAFSIRSLDRLAKSWREHPPFAGDNAFGDVIAGYRENIIRHHSVSAHDQRIASDPAQWLRRHRASIEVPGLNSFGEAASLTILAEFERAPKCIEALGALNRWADRSAVPIERYFDLWLNSCNELGASTLLPNRLRETFVRSQVVVRRLPKGRTRS